MFTLTRDYWEFGLIIFAVMMIGNLIVWAIRYGIDALLYRKKKIKIDEPPKQSKLIVDVPGPSDDVQMKNLENWVSDLDDTVQYFTSELVDVKENFESFKQDVDNTISEQTERINKLEEAAKDEIDDMHRRVRTAELAIDKLEDRVNAIEHDIGDAFEEIHNNANEIDCVRREDKKEQPILIYLSRNATNGASEVHCGPTTLQNATDILSNLRNEISNNGFVTMWYLRKLLDCPDEDDETIAQFSKFIKHIKHGWFDLRRAYISQHPGDKKYYVNLPEEVKLYREDYEVNLSEPATDYDHIYHEGFMYLGDAAKVLNKMRHNVEDHGFTTLEDFERAIGSEDVEFTDGNYGWEDLSDAYIIKRSCEDNKFYVIMPRIIVLDKNEGIDCVRRDQSVVSVAVAKDASKGKMEFAFDTIREATKALAHLRKKLAIKGYLTLIDVKNEIGGHPFLDEKEYGWFDLDAAYISNLNYKYFVNLPNMVRLFVDTDEVPDNARGFIRVKDATKVLDRMRRNVKDYGFTTVRDFKRAIGDEDTTLDDRYRGWKDLSKAYIARKDYIYYVVMPSVIVLDKDKNEGGD